MLSQKTGFWNQTTSAFAVTANGAMYIATGVVGTPGTLIYTSDGISWTQVNTALPVTGDWVQSVFAAGNTVYVGTGQGYVYSTTGNGSVWTQLAQPSQLDSSQVTAVFVDSSGNYYAGTNNGNVYISDNVGNSWAATQPPDNSGVQSLAVSANGNLYAVTTNTRNNNSPPYYSTNQGTAWTAMGASTGNTAYAISVPANTVYIGTIQGNLQYTTNNGTNWATANTQPDGSQISYLFINQSNNLSPLFVESYGIVQVNNGQGSVKGAWYLPATCELNGGIYFNNTTNNFGSCSPAVTSIFSLYSLGALGGSLSSLLNDGDYWSSTEDSGSSANKAWYQSLISVGVGGPFNGDAKSSSKKVRCSRALTI